MDGAQIVCLCLRYSYPPFFMIGSAKFFGLVGSPTLIQFKGHPKGKESPIKRKADILRSRGEALDRVDHG
jgi:hypothetical protein